MNPSLESPSDNSPALGGRGDFQIVIDMISLLDKLDNLLANTAQEAQYAIGNTATFPVSKADFQRLADAKERYLLANYSVEATGVYLQQLPDLDEIWGNVCRAILRYFRSDPPRVGEWRLWLRQVERAGNLAWQKALNATTPITATYVEGRLAMINGIIQKLAVVDEVLDEIHKELHGRDSERLARFSSELGDSIQAVIIITQQGAQLTPESLRNFRSAIRTSRAAVETNWGGDTTGFEMEGTVSPGASRLRRAAQTAELRSSEAGDHQDIALQNTPEALDASDDSHNYDPTILVTVVTLTIVAVSLTGFAWTRADHTIGLLADDDFWLLLQSSILQVAGMVPILFSLAIYKDAPLQPRIWSWFFLGSGLLFAFLAPVLYLVAPKKYSGVVACAGSVAQVLIILEAMFLVKRVVKRDEAREKSG